MRIYVVRHGETDVNLAGLINSRNDSFLNETGIREAQEVRDKLNSIKFDIIYSSPATRAIETAKIIDSNIEIITDIRIHEKDAKDHTLKPIDYANRVKWWNYYTPYPEDVETVKELCDRVFEFIEEIKNKKYENVLVTTHSGVMKAFSTYFNGIPENGDLTKYDTYHCEVREFEI